MKYFWFHHFHYSFYQILFCVHPASHAKINQPVCKPSQTTKFCVMAMIQKTSNCEKYWLELVNARNKLKQYRSNHHKVLKQKNIMQMFFTSSHYLIKNVKTYLKTFCEKHLLTAVSVKTRKVTYELSVLCIKWCNFFCYQYLYV